MQWQGDWEGTDDEEDPLGHISRYIALGRWPRGAGGDLEGGPHCGVY